MYLQWIHINSSWLTFPTGMICICFPIWFVVDYYVSVLENLMQKVFFLYSCRHEKLDASSRLLPIDHPLNFYSRYLQSNLTSWFLDSNICKSLHNTNSCIKLLPVVSLEKYIAYPIYLIIYECLYCNYEWLVLKWVRSVWYKLFWPYDSCHHCWKT